MSAAVAAEPGRVAQGWRIFRRNRVSAVGAAILALLLLLTLLGPWLAPFEAGRTSVGPRLLPPGAPHWFGTDELGRDVLSRALSGIRVSMLVGLGAALIATVLGVVVGAVGGFAGGRADDALSRVTEIFQVVPRFFLAVILVAFFGTSLANIVIAIAVLSWPVIARIVRAEFLTLKQRQFVDAARVAGAGPLTLIFVEILPNAMGPVIVNATLQVGQAMLLEAGLSYLGLGDPTQVSLGLMLQQAQPIMRSAWWASAFPGLLIFLAVFALNLVGDGLNDLFNPRQRDR